MPKYIIIKLLETKIIKNLDSKEKLHIMHKE